MKRKNSSIQLSKKLFKNLGKITMSALILALVAGCPSVVHAEEIGSEEGELKPSDPSQESKNQAITYIYHQHLGNEEDGGPCFGREVYHVHKGNEVDGGECYGKPVYHVHKGNEADGGECYGMILYHEHTGNAGSGGGCFKPVYHSHTSGCYKRVTSEEYGCYTVRYWDTSDGDWEGHDYKYYEMSCGTTVHGTNSSHMHSVLSCGKSSQVEGYTLGCGKTNETPESYVFDCEKKEQLTIDSYQFDCERTTETVDGYALDCEKDLDTPIGKITVTEHQGDNKGSTELSAEFEDLSDGGLSLSDEPFHWTDQNGNSLGSGDRIILSDNGNYSLYTEVTSPDVNKESLRTEIAVDSIIKPTKNDETNKDQNSSSDDRDDGNHGEENDQDDDLDSTDDSVEPSPSPSVSPTPSQTPNVTNQNEEDTSDHMEGDGSDNDSQTTFKSYQPLSEYPELLPDMEEETTEKILQPIMSENTEDLHSNKLNQAKPKSKLKVFFEKPVVRVISITTGTLLILSGLLVLLYLLRMSVRLYNDNGEGKMIYLGRCKVKVIDDGYAIEISDAMAEKAVTNRYCIKPGVFRLFRTEQELLVCRKKRKIAVPMDKEMIVVI